MAISEGLATYEILKTGFFVFVIIIILCIGISLTFYNMNLNYISTEGTITLNTDQLTETLIYFVNDKQYTQKILPITNNNNKIITTQPAYPIGSCIVYYSKTNPNVYNINSNPTIISGIISSVLCVIATIALLWLLFLRNNRDVATVMGGINIVNSLTDKLKIGKIV